jgi:hypothetical protein
MLDQILAFLASASATQIVSGVLLVTEFVMRAWPNSGWSWLVPLAKILDGTCAILSFVSNSLLKPLAAFANNTVAPTPAVAVPAPPTKPAA